MIEEGQQGKGSVTSGIEENGNRGGSSEGEEIEVEGVGEYRNKCLARIFLHVFNFGKNFYQKSYLQIAFEHQYSFR